MEFCSRPTIAATKTRWCWEVFRRRSARRFFIMASWHLFMQDRVQTFLLRRAGAFSIYREGIDRAALNTAIDILAEAQRPLVMFPEGFISRTNDRLNPLLDGVSLIARSAAKKRAKLEPPKKVVVHPVAIRYSFHGDIQPPRPRCWTTSKRA